MAEMRQSSSFGIGHPDPARNLTTQNAILCEHVGHGLALLTIQPGGDRHHESKPDDVDHAAATLADRANRRIMLGGVLGQYAFFRPLPLDEFRRVVEPAIFRVDSLAGGATPLLRVVMDDTSGWRTVYHLAVEEAGDTLIAQAIKFARSGQTDTTAALATWAHLNEDRDACDNTDPGFALPVRIRESPLRVDYEIEAPFDPYPTDDRRPEECVVASHATWQAGKGFSLTFDRARCSQTRFRLAHVWPDGTLRTRVIR